ncbi:hypothetical protein HK098_004348 [Nowakowskiella sp. JEL0407]|nr:hypothetical protein HK098_004348 [Nowakowskiella sp. JEL0407]
MRHVPSPVVVVTTSDPNDPEVKRGTTCSSFTSVSLSPSIISFCLRTPSQMSDLMKRSDAFAVHLLAKHQANHSVAFSSSLTQTNFNQFPYHVDPNTRLPVLLGCLGVMFCRTEKTLVIGDHEVWFGRVDNLLYGDDASSNKHIDPLMYYRSSYVSVGDEVFIQAFEDTTLNFAEWTHRAHVRMAWIYLKEYNSVELAYPHVRLGIQRYNEANKAQITHGYNDTITRFYLYLTQLAIQKDHLNPTDQKSGEDFLQFLQKFKILEDPGLLSKYYSKELLYSAEARERWTLPDLRPLPIIIDDA